MNIKCLSQAAPIYSAIWLLYIQYGRLAEEMKVEKCGSREYEKIKKEIEDFDLNIYLSDSDFEQTFKKAIQVYTITLVM